MRLHRLAQVAWHDPDDDMPKRPQVDQSAMSLVRACVLVLALAACASAHMKLVCPEPRIDDAGIKTGPCGGFDRDGYTTTQLEPGKLTLTVQETIVHRGAPVRVSLSYEDDTHFDQLILVDHIPHDDGAVADQLYYFTIDVPDIACDNCTLQVIQIMTDKGLFGTDAHDPADWSSYYSCANVAIAGTQGPEVWAASYVYTPQPGFPAAGTGYQARAESTGTWKDGWLHDIDGTSVDSQAPYQVTGKGSDQCASPGSLTWLYIALGVGAGVILAVLVFYAYARSR